MIPPLDPHHPERCPLCHVLSETGELQHSDRCAIPAHDAAVWDEGYHAGDEDQWSVRPTINPYREGGSDA